MNPAAILKNMLDEIREMKRYIKVIPTELQAMKAYIKAWLADDVRQHDARLEEYKKQTAILQDIKKFMEAKT